MEINYDYLQMKHNLTYIILSNILKPILIEK